MKIYLAASIAAGREFEKDVSMISSILEKKGHIILTKNNVVKNKDHKNKKSTKKLREYIFKRDYKWLKSCDLFIVEVSVYSHGVGYEHRLAEEFKKPILMLRHNSFKKQNHSAFLDGTGYEKLSFSFYDSGNIRKVLESFLKKYER